MARVTGPLLSLGGSGQIASTQVYATWKGRPYVRRYVIPSNPQTSEQTLTRNTFGWLQNVWRYMPAGALGAWNMYATNSRFTPTNGFIKQNLPQLREANAIYHRAKKGELIDTAIELAGSRAGQFTGSGFENALRTEFRALDRQIIKGTLKGITAEEAAAIKRVANGGPMENIARWFGKFAPTGVVSTAATAGGLFAGANAFGGPVAGTIAAGTGVGAGLGGRAIATALQKRNAEIASALMRRGGAAVPSKSQQAIIAALSAMAPGLGLAARGLSMQGGD